jgi:hypothetical protein
MGPTDACRIRGYPIERRPINRPPQKSGTAMLKFLGSAIGIIFLIGLLVVIGLLALIF